MSQTKGVKRIAFVAPRLAAAGAVGGAETLLFNLAFLAKEAGVEVEYLTTCAKSHYTWANELPAGEETYQGIKVVRFPVNNTRDQEVFLALQTRIESKEDLLDEEENEWVNNSVCSDALISYLKEKSFDGIVVGPYLFGLTITISRTFPSKTLLVPCLHDEPFARPKCIKRIFREVRGLLFNTIPEKNLAIRLYGTQISPKGIVVGFSLNDFPSSKEEGHRIAATQDPYIIFCGRREPLKGTPLLVDYWAAYRRTHPESKLKFVFTGSGEIERPDGLEDEIIDLGFVSEEDKHNLMAGAVAFCHASLNESLGIVLLESWLANTPVLVHAHGEVLQNQTKLANGGLWFKNYPEFDEALTYLLENPTSSQALAAQGRTFTLETYSPAAVTARLKSAIEML